ncbi:MAG: hypothetical protein P8018_07535 [Acidobacteriota bacterium]
MSDEAKDYGPEADFSPSERLAFQLKRLMRVLRTQRGGSKTGKKVFWKELAITVVLLAIWQAFSYWVPNPVFRWDAAKPMYGVPRSYIRIGALGITPYLVAHGLMFWIVMVFSRLRRMEFRYRFRLNYHVLGLTVFFSLLQGWIRMQQGGSREIIQPFFLGHPNLYRLVGVSAFAAGVCFSLWILSLIHRYGLPCPLTCMLVWAAFAHFYFISQTGRALHSVGVTKNHPRQWIFMILMGLILLVIFMWAGGAKVWRTVRETRTARLFMRLKFFEPPFYVFGQFSIHFVGGALGVAADLVFLVTILGGLSWRDPMSRFTNWQLQHYGAAILIAMALVPLGAVAVYRLIYNPVLRLKLGRTLGLEEPADGLRKQTWAALLAWCLFGVGMLGITYFKSSFLNVYWPYVSLPYFSVWSLVLLAFTVVFLRRLYRLRLEGPHAVLLTHGYYEPAKS